MANNSIIGFWTTLDDETKQAKSIVQIYEYEGTLSDDKFKGFKFKYIISNPPFGIDWKKEQKAVEEEHALGKDGRFELGVPKISDGQQLFMMNGLAKMAEEGRMAIIQNGAPLFNGDAGFGPSEIRRYILKMNG